MFRKPINAPYRFERLEPRLLLSADPITASVALLAPDAPSDTLFAGELPPFALKNTEAANDALSLNIDDVSTIFEESPSDVRSVLFVDGSISDYQSLLDGIDGAVEIVVLDAERDGVAQISAYLAVADDVDSIHIASHGNGSGFWLGNTFLNQETLTARQDDFAAWADELTENADILIYGCELASTSAGQSLINELANLTEADIAASDDLTGHASLDGDWQLEFTTGEIESGILISAAAQTNWQQTLGQITLTTGTDQLDGDADTSSLAALALDPGADGLISLREAVKAANANNDADVIFFGSGTYALTSTGLSDDDGDFDIRTSISFVGAGPDNTTILGNNFVRLFEIHDDTDITVTFSDLKLEDGRTNSFGGRDGAALKINSGANTATVDINNVWFLDNQTDLSGGGGQGGAIYNEGVLTITNALLEESVSRFAGGGIYNAAGATLNLVNVTISGGSTTNSGGAGISNDGTATIINSTITNNSASGDGGGIKTTGTLTIGNTIVAGNTAGFNGPDIYNSVDNSLGGNLIGNDDGTGSFGGSDQTDVDPLLGLLMDNGGPLKTHALGGGSTALNAAETSFGPETDQRGYLRDATPDIGAFESGASVTPASGTLWFSTDNAVSSGGQLGQENWDRADIMSFSDPLLNLGSGTTSGTVANEINFGGGAPAFEGLHFVSQTVDIAGGAFQLLAGDVLFNSISNSAVFGSNNVVPLEPNFSATVNADRGDIVVFRPDTAGDYTVGQFAFLLDDIPSSGDIFAFTLVEENTDIGGTNVSAGDLLIVRSGGSNDQDIYIFNATAFGDGTTIGTETLLLEGTDTNVGLNQQIHGLELIESAVNVGGVTLSTGQLLVAIDNNDNVGSNNLDVQENDIFILDVAQSTESAGAGNGSATASRFFTGAHAAFDSPDERFNSLALNITAANEAPTLTAFAAAIDTTNEDTEVEITFAELAAQGDEADTDGTVNGFVVQAVSSGTLLIGANSGSATAFAAGTNDVIGVGLNAYWTPANNQNGTLNAFTVEAKDDDGAESGTPITAQINVSDVNDAPTLTTFAAPIDTTNEDIEVEITFAELAAQGNEADSDGTVDSFVVQAVSTGTLRIGANAGTATAFAAGTNDVIGVGLNAYWTPANNQNGTLNAFTVEAKDDDGAESGTPITAQINVSDVNDAPTLTTFAAPIDTTNEDIEVEITFAELAAQGNEADVDGTVDSFVVQAVSTGTLRIGANAGTATAFAAGTNDVIGVGLNAYWTPANNQNGTLNAFTVEAKDDDGAESGTPITAQINVSDVNDAPTLTTFAAPIDTTNEDIEVEITFAELAAQGNEADVDGTVDSFVVQAVSTGTLRIGANAGTATAFAAGTNDVIGVGLNAYWTPANNQNGTLNAFTVEAKDDDGAESGTPITAQINVSDVNDAPTLTTFAAPIDTINEDTEVEITFAELAAQGNEADIDGTVDSFVVQAVSTGTLRIGANAGTATAFAAGTNDVIGVGLNAYWTPANNQNGTLNAFTVEAKDDDGAESGTPITAQINVSDVNDAPTLTTFAAPIDTTNEDIEVEITFAELAAQGNEADIDGTVDSFVVQAVSTGTLRIGANAGTATAFAAGTNDVIGVGLNAYWTPANNQNGTLNAFTVEAKDDDGAESGTPVTAQINVTDVNDAPTLTTFAAPIDTTNEDIEVEITFAELAAQGNEADVDGTVDSFVVQAVSTGTLRIGANAGAATAFAAGTNDIIGVGLNAYWTPANNQNGTLNAFTVEAKDDDGAESGTPITAQINVSDVNDAPTLTTFAAPIDTTNEDIEVEITFAELAAQGNEADVDGTVDSFVVQAVSTGTLRIGANAGTATAFAAGTNDVIGVGLNAYWTPANNQNGTLNAFTVEAKDDDGAESGTPITAQINVSDVNDAPTLTTFAAPIDTTNEDIEVEITFAELAAQGNEADVDGTVDSFVVQAVSTGTLRIGANAGTATAFAAGTNDVIGVGLNAYWTPANNQNGTLNAFTVEAKDDDGAESGTPITAQISVTDVNDIPTFTNLSANVVTATAAVEEPITFADINAVSNAADVDGTISSYVVQSVLDGTLRIGTSAATATPWAAGTNDIIDGSNIAFWTSSAGASGSVAAFDAVAKDNDNAESVNIIQIVNGVLAVNQAPTLDQNTLTIAESESKIITVADLSASDVDNPVTSIQLSISNVANGQFERVTAPGVSITNFVQSDITSGAIRFVHDGGENPPSYSVTVSDGSLSTPTSPATIIFTNINDAPTVNLNQLTIDQNGKVTLTVNANLNSADPDNSQASLQYEASEVSGGHFENVSSPGVTITTFSHLQLQAGNVQFVHNGTTTAPSYVLTVNDGNLDSAPSTATISFSPTEGNEFFDDEAEAAENFASSEALENLGGKPPGETKTLDTKDDDNDVDNLSLNEQALALQEITEAIQDARTEQSFFKPEIEDYALEETEDKRSSRSLTESIRDLFGRQLLSGAAADPLINQIDIALDVMASVVESSSFKNGLDSLRKDMANESLADKIQIGSSVAVSTGLSIGYVVWLIRGGVLVSSMLSALPAWRFIDPLPILAFGGTDDDEDKESLESLVESDTGDKHNANQPPLSKQV